MEVQCWFVVRAKYQTEKKIRAYFESLFVEYFIPFRKVKVEQRGKRVEKEKPVIPGLLFIRTDYSSALMIANESKIRFSYLRSLGSGKLLVVPDKQMEDFMFLLNFSETAVHISNDHLKKGDRVRVVQGDFAGIEGELIRIKGHKRVVVRLEGLFSLATTYIPSNYLEKI